MGNLNQSKSFFLFPLLMLLVACGAAGGGGNSSSAGDAKETLEPQEALSAASISEISNKIWAIPLQTTKHGRCAIALKLGASGLFGFTQICEESLNSFRYEAIYGDYIYDGSNLTLIAQIDSCADKKTIFWDPTNLGKQVVFKVFKSGEKLVLSDDSTKQRFIELNFANQASFPMTATRGCLAESGSTKTWASYDSGVTPDNVKDRLNEKAADSLPSPSPAAIPTGSPKPKIDFVVFQDNSDSAMFGPIGSLKSQLPSFISSLNGEIDIHFTVLPLHSQRSLSGKYVIASNCSDISGVTGCLAPSQAATFNNSSGDYGWINSVNSSVGSADNGFKNIKSNLMHSSMTSTGFLRTEAKLVIVVLSNGEDIEGMSFTDRGDGVQVLDYSTGTGVFSSYQSFFQNFKGTALNFYSIVSNGGSCSGFSSHRGARYISMADNLGSRSFNLCGTELHTALASISQQVSPSIGAGGCFNLNTIHGSGVTLGFSGTLNGSGSNLQAYLPLQTAVAGIPGDYTNAYWRTTYYGDRTDIAVRGNDVYIQATISATAVSVAKTYGSQICGFYLNAQGLSSSMNGPAWSGNVGGGMLGAVVSNGTQNFVIQL